MNQHHIIAYVRLEFMCYHQPANAYMHQGFSTCLVHLCLQANK